MTSAPGNGIRRYVAENAWVIIVDVAGALLLLSLLLTAAGSPALKDWMFIILTAVPAMAAFTILAARRSEPALEPVRAEPVLERRIIISPRPYDQRTKKAA